MPPRTTRADPVYHCPRCGALVRYRGFYQCTGTGCGVVVEMRELISPDVAARIRAGRAEGTTCDPLF